MSDEMRAKIDRETYDLLKEEFGSYQRGVRHLADQHIKKNEAVEALLNREKHIYEMTKEEREALKNSRDINTITIIEAMADYDNMGHMDKEKVEDILGRIYSKTTVKKKLTDVRKEFKTVTKKEIIKEIVNKNEDKREYKDFLKRVDRKMNEGKIKDWEEIIVINEEERKQIYEKRKKEIENELTKF